MNIMETKLCTRCNLDKDIKGFKYRLCEDCHKQSIKDSYYRTKDLPKIIVTEKECIKCHNIKDIKEYNIQSKRKDGYNAICRECLKIESQKYIVHKEYNVEEGYKICTKCEIPKLFEKFNKAKLGKFGLNAECKECRKELYNQWLDNGGREWNNQYKKDRKAIDPQFKIKILLRGRLSDALKKHIKGGKITKNHSALILIDCTIEFLIQYIESLWLPEMNWSNHGTIWEIDHIRPCADFNLEDEEQQRQCFHYSNLQPLFITTSLAEQYGYTDQIGNRNKNSTYLLV